MMEDVSPSRERYLNRPIYLYGPSGTGKSTIGKVLAEELGRTFFDLDQEIEYRSGMEISNIFSKEGEESFRKRERESLRSSPFQHRAVISLGGGALLDPDNYSFAQKTGNIVCLEANFDTLVNRLQSEILERPLIKRQNIADNLRTLLSNREKHYQSFPLRLDTSQLSPLQAARKIQILLGIFFAKGMGDGYEVLVKNGILEEAGYLAVEKGLEGPIGLVTDDKVGKYYKENVKRNFKRAKLNISTYTFPSGEASKTIDTAIKIWQAFLKAGMERRSTVVALGGGVVGDLAGFAASSYMRGIRWMALPTSLLAMVDASIGGKTGVDLQDGKNLVGAFHPPTLVVTDPTVLDTLPQRDLKAGLAEVVKHGIIGDPDLFELCSIGWDALADWEMVIKRAVAVKLNIIQEDPFEQGKRAALNLGHTIGHGVEHASNYRLSHGESVAIGLSVEAQLSERIGLGSKGLSKNIIACLSSLGLPTKLPENLNPKEIWKAMMVDKKKRKGKLRFALPVDIGDVRTGIEVDDFDLWFDEYSKGGSK